MKKILTTFSCVLIFIAILGGSLFINSNKVSAEESDFYYSEQNKPIFYGATEISISKNSVNTFNTNDTRFRIFAKDFEDGDLTNNIEIISNNVQMEVGDYEIKYKVTDSHNNTTELTVPVHILDNQNKEFLITRTLFTIPSCWNMDIAGFSRCNNGDRQILGIFLPENTSFEIKILSGPQMAIALLNNNSQTESSTIINPNNEFTTIANDRNQVSYASVPLITTVVLNRGADISTTNKIQIRYNDSVKKLDYYHYLDNQTQFFSDWQESQNFCSVIENEVLTIIAPFQDINKLVNHNLYNNGFKTLDEHLSYYKQVVDKMDEMVGLTLNPTLATDQNVRTRYLVKANINGAGAAYYSGNHVGIHSSSISAFFQMNWGGLHELAHGYQGYLGKGYMGLGEVSNNIIGYYIQTNKNIYYHSGNWLGDLKNIEQNKNNNRLASPNFSSEDVSNKLYMLINLFNTFEGEQTYAKLFSYYRKLLVDNNTNGNNLDLTNADVYVKFFADYYKANIIPYFNSWGLDVNDKICEDVYNQKIPCYMILSDSVSNENLTKIKQGENLELSFGLIKSDVLKKYNIKSSLKINIHIDNFDIIKDKNILIQQNGEIIKSISIKNQTLNIENLNTASCTIIMPKNFNYNCSNKIITLKEGENEIEYFFPLIEQNSFHPTSLKIMGIYGTFGYVLELSNNNKIGKITLAGANLGNQNTTWQNKPDDIFVSVTIFNNNNQQINRQEVKGNNYFSVTTQELENINLDYGYYVEVFTQKPNNVCVYSNLTNNRLIDYNTTLETTRYYISENGFERKDIANFDAKEILYQEEKTTYFQILDDYKNKTDNNSTELNNKNINFQEKQNIVLTFEKLNNQDKLIYAELITKIKQGGKPIIKPLKEKETISCGENIDLFSLITCTDNEDYIINPTSTNTIITTNLNTDKSGEYVVQYKIFDSDNNFSTCQILVVVENNLNTTLVIILSIIFSLIIIATITIIFIKRNKKLKNK